LCSEIMLHSSENLSYSCVLSSMNLSKYEEWKDTTAIFDATVFLDCVVSDFLKASEGIPGLTKVRKFTEKGRAVGLGALGFSTLLQKKRIPYESIEAQFLNSEIFKKIKDESLKASQWLAAEFGEPEWLRGYGERMTHRTALAPNKSSALIMGGVSESVSPDPGMVFEQGSAAGGMFRIVPEMYDIMVERGVYSKETLDDIISHVGSVQHVTWLDDHEKIVFKTAFEVDQSVILRYASQRQKHLCQGQSINFYVSEDGDEDRIAELHTKAFLDEDILSLYYIYSRSGIIVNNVCVSCEA
jgi:ribonucleoside-diphosphate reductase alpha chain